MCEIKAGLCKEPKKLFETALDLNACLIQIKLPISVHTCVPIFKLPSNISNMDLQQQKSVLYDNFLVFL